jgi:hypothetical protein
MGQSSLSQRPGFTGSGNRKVGDQNQHNPLANSRVGSGQNPNQNPLGSPGQKTARRNQPSSSGNKV